MSRLKREPSALLDGAVIAAECDERQLFDEPAAIAC
jgi:hypothetical protein